MRSHVIANETQKIFDTTNEELKIPQISYVNHLHKAFKEYMYTNILYIIIIVLMLYGFCKFVNKLIKIRTKSRQDMLLANAKRELEEMFLMTQAKNNGETQIKPFGFI